MNNVIEYNISMVLQIKQGMKALISTKRLKL